MHAAVHPHAAQRVVEMGRVAREAFHQEMRDTAADPVRHKAFVMGSSMIQSLRDLDKVA